MNRNAIYQSVTNSIIEAVETGAGDWKMPWCRSGVSRPVNAFTKKTYRGINVVALWVAADACHYSSGYWASYKQWQELGAQVWKGEKASLITFWKESEREIADQETGEREKKRTLIARQSWVFNADQVEGWTPPPPAARDMVEVMREVEAFILATRATIRPGGNRACYRISSDEIYIPERNHFKDGRTRTASEAYYATLLHELTHWTGHKIRLDRNLSGLFGNEAYAMEEMIAELGAAFLCADLSIGNVSRGDHAAYIANWLNVMRNDSRAIFTAASKAGAASDYLFSLQPDRQSP